MDIRFERGPELRRELRTLPADHYRLIRLLLSREQNGTLFVPIRSMQYLGIIDLEEVAFVDGQGPRMIELSWRDFRPGERKNLDAPVTYTCVHYNANSSDIMSRLQSEFLKALALMAQRQQKTASATVTPLKRD